MKILKPTKVEFSELESFKSQNEVCGTIDSMDEQVKELFLVRNPRFKFNPEYQQELKEFSEGLLSGKSSGGVGNWFYFPWSKYLIHFLPEEMHQEVRTARNKNLISKAEQDKFYGSTVAIVGLSVGSHAALTMSMMGGAKNLKLADFDEVSLSNLNRVRYGATAIGKNKAELVGGMVLELNPYANIYIYEEGVTEANMKEFLLGEDGTPKINVLVESCDNLGLKILLRFAAKDAGVPVVMGTDNGDGVIADVERYDLDSNMPIFNGALGNITLEEFQKFPPQELPKMATRIAGPEYIVPRMLESLTEVGKTLYSWPQLGSAATFCGVVLAYLVRKIVTGDKAKSGKYDLNLDKMLDPDYNSEEEQRKRNEQINNALSKLGLK